MSQYNGIQYGANIKNEEPKQEQNQSSFAFPMDVQRLAYICGSCGAKVMRAVNEAVVCTTCGDHVLFKARSQISSQYIAR